MGHFPNVNLLPAGFHDLNEHEKQKNICFKYMFGISGTPGPQNGSKLLPKTVKRCSQMAPRDPRKHQHNTKNIQNHSISRQQISKYDQNCPGCHPKKQHCQKLSKIAPCCSQIVPRWFKNIQNTKFPDKMIPNL